MAIIAAGDPGTADIINPFLGIYKRKFINESSGASNTTLQDDDDLQWVISSSLINTSWELKITIFYSNAAGSAPGLKVGFAYTAAGATLSWTLLGLDTASGNIHSDGGKAIGNTDNVQTNSGTRAAYVTGTLDIGANAGTFKMQFAQAVSNGTATFVNAGTYGCLKRMT